MTELMHLLASGLYLLGVAVGFQALRRGESSSTVPILLGIGGALHGVGFVVMHGREPQIPLESFPAALSLIGWLIPMAYLFSLGFARVRGVGTWVAAAAAGTTLLAALGLVWLDPPPRDSSPPTWSHAHVLLSALGFSLLALTSLAGLAYLTKDRALKRNQTARFGLPSLESLDRLEHLTLSLGFLLLTLGVLTGFVWGASRGVSPWTQHSIWLVIAWAVYLLPIGMRVLSHQHGDRPARVVVVGFVFLAFSYIGIRILGLST